MKYLSFTLKKIVKNTCIYYVQQLSLFSIRKTTFTRVKLRYSSVPVSTSFLLRAGRIKQEIQVNKPNHPIFLWANNN